LLLLWRLQMQMQMQVQAGGGAVCDTCGVRGDAPAICKVDAILQLA
jgi:hypothetical protein